MYGFPADFDPEVFVGRQLESVLFAEYVIGLRFGGDLLVSVYTSLTYRSADSEDCVDSPSPTVSQTSLPSLVGRVVRAITLESTKKLVLQLEGGGAIDLVDDLEIYESFIINVGDRDIIV